MYKKNPKYMFPSKNPHKASVSDYHCMYMQYASQLCLLVYLYFLLCK